MSNLPNMIQAIQKHFSVGRGGPPLGAAVKGPVASPPPSVLNQAMAAMPTPPKPSGMSPTGLKQGV